MSVRTIQLKKPEIIYQRNNIPQARNKIYQIPVRETCEYCNTGRKHVYKTLYSLYHHLKITHSGEYGYKESVMKLADELIGDLS